MKKWAIMLCCFTVVATAKAAIYRTQSIVDLAVRADAVVEATYLDAKNGTHRFLANAIAGLPVSDTIVVKNLSNRAIGLITGNTELSIRSGAYDHLIIYLANQDGQLEILHDGFRALKEGIVFTPVQHWNPGPLHFSPDQNKTNWSTFKNRVEVVFERVAAVKQQLLIKDPYDRNKKLFSWLKKNGSTFGQQCALQADCGWGSLEWTVFERITEANIAKDTWKVALVRHKINAAAAIEWRRKAGPLSDGGGNSFTTFEDLEFLIQVALNINKPTHVRKQALNYLASASQIVYEKEWEAQYSATQQPRIAMQYKMGDLLFPLLEEPELKELAFYIVRHTMAPFSRSELNRNDLDKLPLLIDLFRNEPPSFYRHQLAEFIVKHTSAKTWKAVTNNDVNLYLSISQVYYTPSENQLKLHLAYHEGQHPIVTKPIVILETSSYRLVVRTFLEHFALPINHDGGSRGRSLTIDTTELPTGSYRVYVSGTAGENDAYRWQTAPETIEISPK